MARKDPFADRPDVAAAVAQARALLEPFKDALRVTIEPRKPRRSRRSPTGDGSYFRRLGTDGRPILYGWRRIADGRRYQVTAKTEGALREKVDALQAKLRAGETPTPGASRTRLAAYADHWLKTIPAHGVRESTVLSYQNALRNYILPTWGDRGFDALTAPAIRQWLLDLSKKKLIRGKRKGETISIGTRRATVAVFKTLLSTASEDGFPVPPAALKALKMPRLDEREVAAFTLEQAQTFAAVDDEFRVLWLVMLFGGLRISEALGLKWSDFADATWHRFEVQRQLDPHATLTDFSFPVLKSKKSRRKVVLPPFVAQALAAHKARQNEDRLRAGPWWQDHDLVICNDHGLPIMRTRANTAFKDTCTAAQVPILSPHALRRTFANLLRHVDLDARSIADLMGHASTTVTDQHYWDRLDPMAERAADRLGGLFGAG
jgi:integrase